MTMEIFAFLQKAQNGKMRRPCERLNGAQSLLSCPCDEPFLQKRRGEPRKNGVLLLKIQAKP